MEKTQYEKWAWLELAMKFLKVMARLYFTVNIYTLFCIKSLKILKPHEKNDPTQRNYMDHSRGYDPMIATSEFFQKHNNKVQ